MPEDNKKVLDQIDPARREFMKRLLVGAAFAAPVVATFSIDALTADPAYGFSPNTTNITNQVCVGDAGYVGPTSFQSHVSVGPIFALLENRVNGQVTFNAEVIGSTVELIDVSVSMVPGATVLSVSILAGPLTAVTMPGSFFSIASSNLDTKLACDLDELSDLMASGDTFCVVQGTFAGKKFSATGPIVAAPASQK